MRIIDTTATRTPVTLARRTSSRAANVELFGLVAASAVVVLGLLLAVWGRIGREPAAAGAPPLPLTTTTSPGVLASRLTMFEHEPERRAIAEALARRLTSAGAPIEHVGGLAAVTMRVDEIRADSRLVQLRARAEGRQPADGLRVLSPADLAALKPHVVVRSRGEYLARLGRAVMAFLAAFWIVHLVRRWRGVPDDPLLLPIVLVLSGLGLIGMIALRDPLRDALIASTFASGVCGGLVLLVGASEIDWESSPLRRAVLLPLTMALALAAALLLLGTGPGSSGVKVNLLGAQPVEAIRLLVVFAMAGALARRLDLLRELHEPATPDRPWLGAVRLPRWRDVRPIVASMALVLAFFFLQKDLGPALVLSGVVIALYAVTRARAASVFLGLGMLAAGFAAAYAIGMPATVGQRVRIWMDPWNNGVTGGNQIAHGWWAMATGATWGSGAGLGSPQLIPEGHTDFVLAALGEQLGFLGVAAVIALYALLGWRSLRIALRAPGDYSALLGVGLALALLVQALVIAGGLLGLLPLTGVVTPFLSYGRSSMLANCAAIGVVLAIGRRQGPVRVHLQRPVRALVAVLVVLALAVAGRAGWLQVVRADQLAVASSLSEQADGGYRFEYNPRLVAAARAIERGTIRDRTGLVLATSRLSEIGRIARTYEAAGVTPVRNCQPESSRCYPLGGLGFSVLGDWVGQTNWGARNASYVEREQDTRLKGFDDRQRLVDVAHPRTGERLRVVRRDYAALLPIVRHGADSSRHDVRAVLDRSREVDVTIDARLQLRVARALRGGIERGAHARGAAVVLDADTGEVLASVSYPWPADVDGLETTGSVAGGAPARDAAVQRTQDALLDRVRYGVYPPGSTFKLLVAAAALRSRPEVQAQTFMCARLPGGRVGQSVPGWRRPVRDDVKDTEPHGAVDLHRGLVVSCNAYFAQLAMALGPRPLLDAVSLFQIEASRPQTTSALRNTLPHAGYGQADVLASPLKLARVAAAIANGGEIVPVAWVRATAPTRGARPADGRRAFPPEPDAPGLDADEGRRVRFLAREDAARLARYMREAVTSGTGRALAGNATPIAGKTGTAEVQDRPSHSWFVGFAPHGGPRKIAFAVLIEHAGYGGRAAAPVAGEIVDAARALGYVR